MIKKNPFNNSSKMLFTLSLLWAGVLLLIGAWWVYVMINFESFLGHADRPRITKMLAWEGGSFLVLLMLLSFSLLILYLKDQGKTKSLQAFFASLTHELKTPLASIRLQGEVINEILESKNDPTLDKLIGRLIDDTAKLETQMDKILQLSRIERGGELNLTSLSLVPFIKKLAKTWVPDHEVEIIANDTLGSIEVDEFALQLIMKNLLENTRIHTTSKKIQIKITEDKKVLKFSYFDHGEFKGELEKLGTIFYKHNSTKGSGIGLYLSQKLLEKMDGDLTVTPRAGGLQFDLTFKRSEEINA
ncbi:HAMP domain-containing sensor histidine kinase [Bacteriovorax sp. PP10]|uniref:histidine kinase n=1 Tax=Bacteriovorax antarcticus TaxID=3088717 RepID=A0ABU5VTP4_9BACT|nr:HAMP domain-containing sensor histidine kinase [Bacteriovorax sp. PP10]MEA9356418.1 HAMP domain-containing sensor histidine kinase [Bacteriovorax sp. PP10]